MKMRYLIIFACITMICLSSCNNSQKEAHKNEIYSRSDIEVVNSILTYDDFVGHPKSEFNYFSEFNFSIDGILHAMNSFMPTNIRSYIDDVIIDGEFLLVRYDMKEWVKAIRKLADDLQSYKENGKGYFPVKESKVILEDLLDGIAYTDLHRPGITPREFIIFPRLLEFTVHLCPDISKVATYTSLDNKVGVVTIEAVNFGGYDFTALITKAGKTCEIHYLPRSLCNVNRIRYVGSVEDFEYYLLSYEDNYLNPMPYPTIYLVELSKGEYADIYDLSYTINLSEWNSFIFDDEAADKYQIYFNPKEISWSWCKKNKYGNLEKIDNSRSLCVDLESHSLRFE